MEKSFPGVGVAALVVREGRCLLVRRGRAPNAGRWALPGGKLHWGEGLEEGVLRELREETGVEAQVAQLVDVAEIIEPSHHFLVLAYACRWLAGDGVVGDDAEALGWFSKNELDALGEALLPGVRRLVERRLAGPVE